jgi:hypothetical protein
MEQKVLSDTFMLCMILKFRSDGEERTDTTTSACVCFKTAD